MKNITFMKITTFLYCIWILSISGMDIQKLPIDLSSPQAQESLLRFKRNADSLIENGFDNLATSKNKDADIKNISYLINSMIEYIKTYDSEAQEYRINRLNDIKTQVPLVSNQIMDLQKWYFEIEPYPTLQDKQIFLEKGRPYQKILTQWEEEVRAIEKETTKRIKQKIITPQIELFQSSLGVKEQQEVVRKEKSEKLEQQKSILLGDIKRHISHIEISGWNREIKIFLLQLMYWEIYKDQKFLKEKDKIKQAQLKTEWTNKLNFLGQVLNKFQASLPKITHEYGGTAFPKFTYEINTIPEDAPQELKDIFNNFKNKQREIELKSPYWKLEAYVSRIQRKTKQFETETSYVQGIFGIGKKAKEWLFPGDKPKPTLTLAEINKLRKQKNLPLISPEDVELTGEQKLKGAQLKKPTSEQESTQTDLPAKILQSIQADQQEINKIVSQEIGLLETQIKQKNIDPFTLQGMRYKIVRLGEYIEKLTDQIKIMQYKIFKHVPVHDEINYSPLENNYFLGVLLLTNECGKTQNEKYFNAAIIFQLKHIYSSSIHQLFISFDDSKNESQLFKIRSNYIKKDSEGKTTIDVTKLKKDVYTAYFSNSKYTSDLYKIIPFLLDAIGLYENYAKIDLLNVLLGLQERHQPFTYIFNAIKKILALKNPWNQEKTIACLMLLDQVCATKTNTPGTSFFFKNQQKLNADWVKKIAQGINEQNDVKIINAYIDLLDTEFIFNGLLQQPVEKQTTNFDKIQEEIDRLKHLLSDGDLKKNSILYGEIIENLIKYISFKYEKKPNVNEENVANLPVDYFKNINNDIDYLFTLSKSYENQAIVFAIENISGQFISHANIFIDHIIKEIKENRITSEQAQQKVTAFFDAEDIEGSTLSTIKRKAIDQIKEISEQNIAATAAAKPVPTQMLELEVEEPKIEIPLEKPVAMEPPAESETEQKEQEGKSLAEEILLRKIVEEREKRAQEKILEEEKLEQQKILEREEILKGKQPASPEPSIQKDVKDNDRKKLAQTLKNRVILESNIRFEKPLARNILENSLIETLNTNVLSAEPFSSDITSFINHIILIGENIEKIKTQKINIPYDLTQYISALATHPLLDKKLENSLMNISPDVFKGNEVNFDLFKKACATINDYFKGFPVPEEIPATVAPQQILQQEKPQVPAQPEQPAVQKTEISAGTPSAIVQPQEAPAVPPAVEPQQIIKSEPIQHTDQPKTDVQSTVVSSEPNPEKPQEGGIIQTFINGASYVINGLWNMMSAPFRIIGNYFRSISG